MNAMYEVTLKVTVFHKIGKELKDLKSDREFAEDMAHMICDEATNAGAVATYDILKSSVSVH